MDSRRFTVVVVAGNRGKLLIPVPFDPDLVWGVKQRHHVAGSVNGAGVRAIIDPAGDGFAFTLGPTSPARFGVAPGDEVTVEIAPEGRNAATSPTTWPPRWLPTQTPERSSTRSLSSIGARTFAGSMGPSADPNCALNASRK